MASESSSVPVSILTGFLGAGKTTLLRHLLTEKHGLRIAVIQNELSATSGLEASTMQGPGGETFDRWMELANGCVCCEVRDELPFALERLMEAKGRFDYVLIETTGMADPGPVAASLWLDDALESPLELDGVITLVDAVHAHRQLHTVECSRQIASADTLVLNKCDDAAAAGVDLDRLCERLRAINAVAPQLRASHSQLPVASILNRRAYAREGPLLPRAPGCGWATTAPVAPATARRAVGVGPACGECEEEAEAEADRAEGAPRVAQGRVAPTSPVSSPVSLHADRRFGTVTLLLGRAPLRLPLLQGFLASLFWPDDDADPPPAAPHGTAGEAAGPADAVEVYRAKGELAVADEEVGGVVARYTLQAVHETWELERGRPWGEEEVAESRLVFIGRNLDEATLRAMLLACVACERRS